MGLGKPFTLTYCLLLILAKPLFAQTTVNPDLSVVGDMRYVLRNANGADLANQKEMSFEFSELEINLGAYLNPYARADVFLSIHGVEGPIDLEEAHSTVLRGLPFSLQLKFGKYLLDIGKINTQHPHQWPWLQFPLMHRAFLGNEGARVIGLHISRLQPVGESALTLTANAFRSDFFESDAEDSVAANASPQSDPAELGFSGRISLFNSFTDALSIETGLSYLHGSHDPEQKLDVSVAALDLKIKWRPDAYRGVSFVVEGMLSDRELDSAVTGRDSNTALGAFSFLEVKWRKRFDAGAYLDFTENPDDDLRAVAAGAFFGFMPVEETARYSVVYRHETSDAYDGSNIGLTFQVLWALGPHKPHQF